MLFDKYYRQSVTANQGIQMKEETTSAIYLMHKYWGKKPSNELSKIVREYSAPEDTVFDPFAGFGGIGVESLLQNRNVIINDLNPSAAFIAKNILNENIDIQKYKELLKSVKEAYRDIEKKWYYFKGDRILTILRNNKDVPLKLRLRRDKTSVEVTLSEDESKGFLEQENNYHIDTWYPTDDLIVNSRINAKPGMTVADLFPKRALICQSYLYSLIDRLDDSPEKELLRFSFTSNLANCSKLVPPIISRGDMAQGAWMTGFYIGETYLENNVFHYFENRANKSLKGKECYLSLRKSRNVRTSYSVLNEDAKKLSLADSSVDLVFTDFPYGDTVPYFEQSQLWNTWLKKAVDYSNEIVVSNSTRRNKSIENFGVDIDKAIKEISRVLKDDKYFVFTFHSLSGAEWTAIVNALNKYGFTFVECNVMLQKTLPPRQLNRSNSIKGDIIAVYRKNGSTTKKDDFYAVLNENIDNALKKKKRFETNDLIILCIKSLLSTGFSDSINFRELFEKRFTIDERSNKWRLRK